MATRRNFFKYLGLAGGAAAGGAVTAASLVASSAKSEAVKQLEDGNRPSISFTQDFGKNDNERMRIDGYYNAHIGTSAPKTKLKTVNIDMTPGPDGELYLKTNGKWRKIVTE